MSKKVVLKTQVNDASVTDFLKTVTSEEKKADSMALLDLFKKVTGEKPRMWGSSIVGFGEYTYKSPTTGRSGDWFMTGFSPRKQNLTVYIMPGFGRYTALLKKLGKHKIGGGCLYFNKLSDVDIKTLEELIKDAYKHMKDTHAKSKN
jgi:hypothetical protein